MEEESNKFRHQFTLYCSTLDGIGYKDNTLYPDCHAITNEADLYAAVQRDFMFCQMKNYYRAGKNFINADCVAADLDNSHSENPAAWLDRDVLENKLSAFMGGAVEIYSFASRHCGREKKQVNKDGTVTILPARQKWHYLLPLGESIIEPGTIKDIMQMLREDDFLPELDDEVNSEAQTIFGTSKAVLDEYPIKVYDGEFTILDVYRKWRQLHPKQKPAEPVKTVKKSINTVYQENDGTWHAWLQHNLGDMLAVIPADDRKIWLRVGSALKNEGFSFDIFDAWSRTAANYGETESTWKSFKNPDYTGKNITALAKQHGWKPLKEEWLEIPIEEQADHPLDFDSTISDDSVRFDHVEWARLNRWNLSRAEKNPVNGDIRYTGNCCYCGSVNALFFIHSNNKCGFFCPDCKEKKWTGEDGARRTIERKHEAELFAGKPGFNGSTDDQKPASQEGSGASETVNKEESTAAAPIMAPEWDKLTEADFTNKQSMLYQYLISTRHRAKEDPITFTEATMKAEASAKRLKVSVRLFGKLFNALYDQVYGAISAKREAPVNETAWSGSGYKLECGDYSCTEAGVTRINEYGEEVVVCKHPITPTAILENVNSGEFFIQLSYRLHNRGWSSTILSQRAIASKKDIVDLAAIGIDATTDNDRDLVQYLRYMVTNEHNRNTIPALKLVDHLGWVNGEFAPYTEEYTLNPKGGFVDLQNSIKPTGNPDKWLRVAKMLRNRDFIGARAALASSFASVLISLAGGLPYVLHLYGGSGKGKSLIIRICASVWANGEIEGGNYVVTASSTANALESTAGFLHSLPLCLDELETLKLRAGETFDSLVYRLTEGKGKSRATKDGSLAVNTASWRNTAIITGENPILDDSSRTGSLNRVIQFEIMNQLFTPDEGMEISTITSENYGFAGKQFIEQLQQLDDPVKEIKAKVASKLEEIRKAKNSFTGKQELSAAYLLAADELATQWIFKDGLQLTAAEIAPFLATEESIDQNRHILEWLLGYIAGHPDKFTYSGEYNDHEIYGAQEYDENGDVKRFIIIKTAFDEILKKQGFSPVTFLSWLDQHNFLDKRERHKTGTYRFKNVDGKSNPVPCVIIKNAAVEAWETANEEKRSMHPGFTEDDDLEIPF